MNLGQSRSPVPTGYILIINFNVYLRGEMKIVFFPAFSFLYSVLENWLQKQASEGLILVKKQWWIWYFKKRQPSQRCYFLWLRRSKGRDCLSLATSVHNEFGKDTLFLNDLYMISPFVTELNPKKVNENLKYYRQKRNYICMKIAAGNFLGMVVLLIFSLMANILVNFIIICVLYFGIALLLNSLQYFFSCRKSI